MKSKKSKFKIALVALLVSLAVEDAYSIKAVPEQARKALGAISQEEQLLFHQSLSSSDNAPIWRIPSLIKMKNGVLLAAADKRWQHRGDWGNIDIAIRTSADNGKNWGDITTVLDLPSNGVALTPDNPPKFNPWGVRQRNPEYRNSAFVMDSVMVQDKTNGRIILAVDMFPQSTGLSVVADNGVRDFGPGYVNIGGKSYLKLNKDGKQWTLRENGVVFDEYNQETPFRVVVQGDPKQHFKNLGDVYEISNTQKLGNIYLNKDGENSEVPFTVPHTSYFWIITSDDNGKTWNNPVDITPQVKKDWMRFFGTGPGVGIQTKSGNLLLPVYYFNRNNKQSSALIISRDGGKTWELGQSPNDTRNNTTSETLNYTYSDDGKEITESQLVELDNGDIKLFMRNNSGRVIMSTSKDGGYSWVDTQKVEELHHGYSQFSVIKFSKRINGKEWLIFSGQSEAGSGGDSLRRNGKILLGEVGENGEITWKRETWVRPVDSVGLANGSLSNGYVYSSMTELNNGGIGLAYENTTDYTTIMYFPFDLQELFWRDYKIFADSRRETPLEISYQSPNEETFYKIGDGEMVKVGEGANPAKLVVEEGIATLSQTPDAQGNVQAYSDVQVNSQGTLRVGNDYSQVPLENLHLNGGTLDVNGHYFIIDHHNNREGLRAENINGNIINTKDDVTLEYQVGGNTTLNGKLGDIESRGVLNFNYIPESANSELRLTGDSTLGTLNVQKGTLVLAPKTNHLAETTHIEPNGTLRLEDSVLNTKLTEIAPNANLIAKVSAQNVAALFSERVIGDGNLIKQGEGVLLLDGEIAHRGKTDIQQGSVWLNGGSLSGSEVILGAGTQLAGSGKINAKTQWSLGSRIAPSLYQNLDVSQERAANVFSPQTLSFTDVENLGAEVELRVNNHHDDLTQWTHDRLVIEGDLKTQSAVPVDVVLLGDRQGKSDRNHNGAYDANEGLSLIRVYGEGALSQFVLRQAQDLSHSPYDLSLVSVDKGIAGNYYDYQLHNTLIDANGNAVTPIIKASVPSPQVEPTPQVAPSPQVEPTPQVMPNPQVAPIPQVTPTPPARAKLKAQVPSYLVATNAMLSQGNALRDRFLDNAYAKEKQGFYVLQQYDKRRYESDLSFSNYGYDFDSKQHSTLFGGYIPLTAQTELHGGIGFSRQKVTPKAADGASETRYKTTSLLFALQHKWDNWRLSGGVGVHFHRGDVSAAGASGKIKGTQYQVDTELGYQIGDEQFRITPTVGLSYQQLHVNIDDRSMSSLSIEQDKRRVLTPSLGAYAEWNQARFQWKLGAFYEHNQDSGKDLYVGTERFLTGKLGNAVVVKASGDIALTPQLSIGVQLNHRHSVSNAKLKQTDVAGKLEYRF